MDLRALQEIANGRADPGFQTSGDSVPIQDTSEEINIHPLALLKMLKHCRHGVPFEVMGLMLGSYTDPFTIEVKDVFAMPQVGTAVSVETVDPEY